jgi:hypothetical protein
VKLINLHHYEKRRDASVCPSTQLVNAAAIFSEDSCIRMATLRDGCLTMQLVDADKPDAQPWPSDPDAHNFLTQFMAVSAHDAQPAGAWPLHGPALGTEACSSIVVIIGLCT